MKRREFLAAMVGATAVGPVAAAGADTAGGFLLPASMRDEVMAALQRMIEEEAMAKIRAIQEEEFRVLIEGVRTDYPVGLLRCHQRTGTETVTS